MKLKRAIHVGLIATGGAIMGCSSSNGDRGRQVYSARVAIVGTGAITPDNKVKALEVILLRKGYAVQSPSVPWKDGFALLSASRGDSASGSNSADSANTTSEFVLTGLTIDGLMGFEIVTKARFTPDLAAKHPWTGAAAISAELSAEQAEWIRVLSQ